MKVILNLFVLIFLVFGFKSYSQSIVTNIDKKMSSLTTSKASILDDMVNGVTTSLYVNSEGQATLFKGEASKVLVLNIESAQDVQILQKKYSKEFKYVELIDFVWDGKSSIDFSVEILETFSNLKYFYIRSYKVLSDEIIQDNFTELIELLKHKEGVELLYLTMEEPN